MTLSTKNEQQGIVLSLTETGVDRRNR
jgi:hypothetical protein